MDYISIGIICFIISIFMISFVWRWINLPNEGDYQIRYYVHGIIEVERYCFNKWMFCCSFVTEREAETYIKTNIDQEKAVKEFKRTHRPRRVPPYKTI
jgi:hypothetical protein